MSFKVREKYLDPDLQDALAWVDGRNALTADLSTGGNEILGLPASPSATGAASKEYVDTAVSGAGGSAPTSDDKNVASLAVTTDYGTTGITITSTPAGDSYVAVYLTGVLVTLGDGVRTEFCYFSADGGTTARAIADIAAGDTLYWNAAISTVSLTTLDTFDLHYNV